MKTLLVSNIFTDVFWLKFITHWSISQLHTDTNAFYQIADIGRNVFKIFGHLSNFLKNTYMVKY